MSEWAMGYWTGLAAGLAGALAGQYLAYFQIRKEDYAKWKAQHEAKRHA